MSDTYPGGGARAPLLRHHLPPQGVSPTTQPIYRSFRPGDVRHSQADISKAQRLLGYAPSHRLSDGVAEAMPWYVSSAKSA